MSSEQPEWPGEYPPDFGDGDCPRCGGTGEVYRECEDPECRCEGFEVVCEACGGSGYRAHDLDDPDHGDD